MRTGVLTESLEDYLLEIYLLDREKRVVRIKDIAKRRNVKLPSVVKALEELSKRKYLVHERYGHVELTDFGVDRAKKLYERHIKIYRFLHDILGVDGNIAERDSHKIEHDLNQITLERLEALTNFFDDMSIEEKKIWRQRLNYFLEAEKHSDFKGDSGMKTIRKEKTLAELDVGMSGRIKKVKAGMGSLKTRLLDMGAVPGTEIKVIKKAPLGDPIDVQIMGYHLSLRKDEADKLIVE